MKTRLIGFLVTIVALLLFAGVWRVVYSGRKGKSPQPAPGKETEASFATAEHTIPAVVSPNGEPTRRPVMESALPAMLAQPAPPSHGDRIDSQPAASRLNSSSPTALPTVAPGVVPSATEMVSLIFQLDNRVLRVHTQSVVNATMRLPPWMASIAPVRGIYHRLLSATGAVLAQDLMADPAVLYYDSPRPGGNGELEGGVVVQTQVAFHVRYPRMADMDQIELYQVESGTDLTQLSRTSPGYYGSFRLSPATR